MERGLQTDLIAWKNKNRRLPLIIRGARQVGKTYLMRWLGENHFQQFTYFNFDERPELKEFFKINKEADRIIRSLELISGKSITENTLIILDEIQECPEALNALKYFAEKRPEIPVICAGSFLGIMLNTGHSFPVGKVEFLTLHPMTFREVLHYRDEKIARTIGQINLTAPLPQLFYNELLDHFKRYLVTGGLPAVVNALQPTGTFQESEQVLENLILAYRGDFAKHPLMSDIAKITQVFDSLPAQLARENKKFVYNLVRSGARAREYEDALQWLVNCGLVHRVHAISKPGLPLSAYEEHGAFKLYAFDTGILRRLSRLNAGVYAEGNRMFTEFKGALTENYILQSLLAQFNDTPFYWTSGNTAEVDFIIQYKNQIIPIEVKSDENIKSRSLTLYHQKFNPALRIRYSLKNTDRQENLLNIPLFLADYTKDIIFQCGSHLLQ